MIQIDELPWDVKSRMSFFLLGQRSIVESKGEHDMANTSSKSSESNRLRSFGSTLDQGIVFLGIVFILAKVFEVEPVASWSWWLVTVPFWGSWLFLGVFFLIVFVVVFFFDLVKQLRLRKKARRRLH